MRRFLLLVACALWLGAGIDQTAVAAEAKGQVVHGQLYLVGANGRRSLAPDGDYRTREGTTLKVRNGKILGGHPNGVLTGLLLPAVQAPRATHQGPMNPGSLRGFNPQPEPPAHMAPHQ